VRGTHLALFDRMRAARIHAYRQPLALVECTLWGTLKELREVVALVEDGRLTLGEAETAPLEQINDVYGRLKRGEVHGRVIVTP
jgi:D-arabinose 1-dehydrogenase-like Zn-dependent alcohol dehydrogenase